MDEWYQARWATGSSYAKWPDKESCFEDYYSKAEPDGEIKPLAEELLNIFSNRGIEATFFFTGEIAQYYPELVKQVSKNGHEIGSHNWEHKDYTNENREQFYEHLIKSKNLLEELSGQEVLGYRAPNSTLSSYMIEDLRKAGFKYDSSVTPTRPWLGKFGNFRKAPLNPYELSASDFAEEGNSGLFELPWPVFPLGHLPSGSGIMTRIAGYWYTIISLEYALRTGDSVYYFHPYEIGPTPEIDDLNIYGRILLRNLGDNYRKMLMKILDRYKNRFKTGKQLVQKNFNF